MSSLLLRFWKGSEFLSFRSFLQIPSPQAVCPSPLMSVPVCVYMSVYVCMLLYMNMRVLVCVQESARVDVCFLAHSSGTRCQSTGRVALAERRDCPHLQPSLHKGSEWHLLPGRAEGQSSAAVSPCARAFPSRDAAGAFCSPVEGHPPMSWHFAHPHFCADGVNRPQSFGNNPEVPWSVRWGGG